MKNKKGVGLKMAMMLAIIVAIIAVASVHPAASQPTFKHGKTVWLLMPFTGAFFWRALVAYKEQAVKADGWNFNFATAEGSDTTQFDQIITYAQKADLLIVFPTSMGGVNEAIRRAEEEYRCPVIVYKNYITGKSRFCISYDDFEAGESMAKEAVKWLQDKYGTTRGRTVIAVNGDLKLSGWKFRQDGFNWIKKNHPEIKYLEILGGLRPEGWAEAIDAALAGAGADADAIVSASGGPYILGTLRSLEKYGKLFHAGDPKHIFITNIDGGPADLNNIRRGYVDSVYSQTPDSIAFAQWELAKKYIIKDPSYQYPPFKMPEIPLPLNIEQPKGAYWGGKHLVMPVQTVPFSKTPIGNTPIPRVDRNNVNTWDLYGNSVATLVGEDIKPLPTFAAKGAEPPWSAKLLSDHKAWFERFGKK